MSFPTIFGATAAGATTWLFAEYLLHRFVGHGRGRSAFAIEHRRHHSVGDYFAPTSKKVAHVTPVIAAIALVASLVAGPLVGVPYGLGLAAMYCAYELLHRRLHTHPPRGWYGRWARRHHFFHHFHDPALNHGVTTPLFDLAFGTRSVAGTPVRVPERLAMRWLVDPETGSVRAEHARDYELRRT